MAAIANHHHHHLLLPSPTGPSRKRPHHDVVQASLGLGPGASSPGPVVSERLSMDTVKDVDADEDPRVQRFKTLYDESERRLRTLFGRDGRNLVKRRRLDDDGTAQGPAAAAAAADDPSAPVAPSKPARSIDEDDYDDYEDDDPDHADVTTSLSNTQDATRAPAMTATTTTRPAEPSIPNRSSEEVREKLQEDKKAAEDTAKRAFHTLFYTLENDRDAMLEQQKLEELDRQVDAEMSGQGPHGPNLATAGPSGPQPQGKLSSANLGASSLTLKHLIARIDAKRSQVRASDAELRTLMSDVRKNRSKWANEDKVGQEELYEAAEKVLSELKAMTEHSQPFLTRVNKKDAPDYYQIIKHPMDLGNMTKKLKSLTYKSKQDFVDDLNIIWANCLKYNADPSHYLRKHALAMRKETDKLVPLIPDIVIRDRSEVEAEERRMQNGGLDVDLDGAEESDDEPIMSTRGRKAPSKTSRKGTNSARKAPPSAPVRGSPDPKSSSSSSSTIQRVGSSSTTTIMTTTTSTTNLRAEFRRADSDATLDGSFNRLSTPPHGGCGGGGGGGGGGDLGGSSPMIVNGLAGSTHPASQADSVEADAYASLANGVAGAPGATASVDDVIHDDFEYKTWKQVTKKDRARLTAERHRLFKHDRINPDEPALLRTKATMRRWQRKHRRCMIENFGLQPWMADDGRESPDVAQDGETLAEGMEGDDENTLPDYYDTLGAIPEIPPSLQWNVDAQGELIDPPDRILYMAPKGTFVQPVSPLTKRMDANMRQMQETRKICSKISIIKQMQLQNQLYQNQFQKYDPEPLIEKDIEPMVTSFDGPVMAPPVSRAALQRSVAKIFYHAGFEDYQPSAMEAMTEIAADFIEKFIRTISEHRKAPKVPAPRGRAHHNDNNDGDKSSRRRSGAPRWVPRWSDERTVLHVLHECGMDPESLESYVKDDVERLGSKVGVMHERMKSHLAELLRPALNNNGSDGVEAFNDGSDQFVGGDFADDIGEDFFGFKELGLDVELGLSSNSVPLHLLQSRMHAAYQAQTTSAIATSAASLAPLPPYEPITLQNLKSQIGLVQNFFLAKLHANGDEPLVEDEDLPQKRRLPKPRLPPTGKISSPRKRPIKEQGGGNKSKKKKVEKKDGGVGSGDVVVGGGVGVGQAANATPTSTTGSVPAPGSTLTAAAAAAAATVPESNITSTTMTATSSSTIVNTSSTVNDKNRSIEKGSSLGKLKLALPTGISNSGSITIVDGGGGGGGSEVGADGGSPSGLQPSKVMDGDGDDADGDEDVMDGGPLLSGMGSGVHNAGNGGMVIEGGGGGGEME